MDERARKRQRTESKGPPATPVSSTSVSLAVAAVTSPIRAERIQEQRELHDLNQRLEHYILHSRQRDAEVNSIERAKENLRQAHANVVAQMEQSHADEVETLKRQKLDAVAEARDFEMENERLQSQVNNLNTRCQELESRGNETDNSNKELETQIARLRSQVETMRSETTRLTRESQEQQNQLNRLIPDLDKERDRADDALKEAAKYRAELKEAEEEIANLKGKYTTQVSRLEEEKNSLDSKLTMLEQKIRKAFGEQLRAILADRAASFEEEKEDALNELKGVYDEQIAHLQAKLTDADEEAQRTQDEMDSLRSRVAEAKATAGKTSRLERELAEAKEANERLHQQVEENESAAARSAQLQSEVDSLKQDREQLRQKASHMKHSFNQREMEYNQVLDKSVVLSQEIRAYRTLLDEEYSRMNLPIPLQYISHDVPDVRVSRFCPEGSYITLMNASGESVSLEGWSLRSDMGQQFSFPDIELKTGALVTVYTGADAREMEEMPSKLAWEEDPVDLFGPKGSLFLSDSENNDICQVLISRVVTSED